MLRYFYAGKIIGINCIGLVLKPQYFVFKNFFKKMSKKA